MKISFKGYYEPTPKNIRKWGDSLLAISLFLSGYLVYFNSKILAIIIMAIGGIGKFASNFCSDNNNDNPSQS